MNDIVKQKNSMTDFINGQRDCRDGRQPKNDASEAYLSGYSFQYEMEQVISEMTSGH